ncbi:MAG: hypothetical protein AAGC55_24985 [Myxococcota bacterium]
MSGPMYSFRVTSPTVRALLDKLPHRSRFIRDAVTERLLGEAVNAGAEPATSEPVVSPDPSMDALRSGLAAISEAGTALMARSGADLTPELRAGLDGICEAAAQLAAQTRQDPSTARDDEGGDPDLEHDPSSGADDLSADFPNSDKDTQS